MNHLPSTNNYTIEEKKRVMVGSTKIHIFICVLIMYEFVSTCQSVIFSLSTLLRRQFLNVILTNRLHAQINEWLVIKNRSIKLKKIEIDSCSFFSSRSFFQWCFVLTTLRLTFDIQLNVPFSKF